MKDRRFDLHSLRDNSLEQVCMWNKRSVCKLLALATMLLAGCAADFKMTAMPRDSGKVYVGLLHGNGDGTGNASIQIEGVLYAGPVVRSGSNDSLMFGTTQGSTTQGLAYTAAITAVAEGDKFVKAIMSSASGRGLRCELRGRGATGGGVCVDDENRLYDILLVRQ